MTFQITIGLSIILYGLVYSTLAAIPFKNTGQLASKTFMQYMPDNLVISSCLLLNFLFETIFLGMQFRLDFPIICILTASILTKFISGFNMDRNIPELEGVFITLTGLGILLLTTSNLFVAMILIEIISITLYTFVPLRKDIGGALAGGHYFIYGSFMACIAYTGLLLIYKETSNFDISIV